MNLSLRPVEFQGFVSSRILLDRRHDLLLRLMDLSSIGFALHNKPSNVLVSEIQSMIPEVQMVMASETGNDGEEKTSRDEAKKKLEEDPLASMSPAERQRYEMAQNLSMALGLDNVDLCVRALKRHDDDPNVTAEWFMTSPVEVERLREEIEAEKLAIFTPGDSSKDVDDDELDDDVVEERERQVAADLLKKAKEREEQARNLVDIYDVPFKLAYVFDAPAFRSLSLLLSAFLHSQTHTHTHNNNNNRYAALELHNGDVNSAANWMLDAGMKFYGVEGLKSEKEEKIDETLKEKIDDSAALEDVADVEPLVTDDSTEGGGKTVTRRRRIPECRVASLSALPYDKDGEEEIKIHLTAQWSGLLVTMSGASSTRSLFSVTGCLLPPRCWQDAMRKLTDASSPTILIGPSDPTEVRIRNLEPETALMTQIRCNAKEMRWHSSVYGASLEDTKNLWNMVSKTEDAFASQTARHVFLEMLRVVWCTRHVETRQAILGSLEVNRVVDFVKLSAASEGTFTSGEDDEVEKKEEEEEDTFVQDSVAWNSASQTSKLKWLLRAVRVCVCVRVQPSRLITLCLSHVVFLLFKYSNSNSTYTHRYYDAKQIDSVVIWPRNL